MTKTMKKSFFNAFIALFTSSVLIGCQTVSTENNWPKDIPARNLFIEAYNEQVANNTNDTKLETHLQWIKRFYHGSLIYPIGWNDMIDMLVTSLDRDQVSATKRLQDLGFRISVEWAQSNKHRKINSSNIATWGNALRTSVKREQQLEFLGLVEKDVDDLIAGKINAKEITEDRYYPPEDFDDF